MSGQAGQKSPRVAWLDATLDLPELAQLAGVLSKDPFWVSIRGSATHPLHARLEAGMAAVFASGQDTANDWMKGLLSSDQVITDMGIQLDRRFRDDFLARRLDIDCAKMAVNAELFELLRAIRAEAIVVIATDNMDCFARAFHNARSRPRRARTRDSQAFTSQGGTAIQWKMGTHATSEATGQLQHWLDQQLGGTTRACSTAPAGASAS